MQFKYLWCFLVLFCVAVPSSFCQEKTPSSSVVEGAKKEKKLIWWTVVPPRAAHALAERFKKTYPFVEDVEIWRARSEAILDRMLSESTAGRHTWDIAMPSPQSRQLLVERNIVQKWSAPGLANLPAAAKGPNGYWAMLGGNVMVIGYNTKLVSSQDVPKSYNDLLDPKWKGKLGINADLRLWMVLAQPDSWGEKKTKAFMTQLAKNKPRIQTGYLQTIQLVIAGDLQMSDAILGHILANQKKGAPVDWVRASPAVITGAVQFMSRNAIHPNVAQLWMDWTYSQQGQAALDSLGFRGSPFPGSDTQQSEAIKGLPYIVRDMEFYTHAKDYMQQLQSIMGIK